MTPKPGKINLTQSLKELNDIVEWFAQQEDVDVEAGLVKVREATALIKDSKTRLAEVQNEFKEIEERYKRTGETFKTIEYKSRVIYITQWNSKYNCFCVWKHMCKNPMFRMTTGMTGSVTHKYGEDSIMFSEYENGESEYSVHPLFEELSSLSK